MNKVYSFRDGIYRVNEFPGRGRAFSEEGKMDVKTFAWRAEISFSLTYQLIGDGQVPHRWNSLHSGRKGSSAPLHRIHAYQFSP